MRDRRHITILNKSQQDLTWLAYICIPQSWPMWRVHPCGASTTRRRTRARGIWPAPDEYSKGGPLCYQKRMLLQPFRRFSHNVHRMRPILPAFIRPEPRDVRKIRLFLRRCAGCKILKCIKFCLQPSLGIPFALISEHQVSRVMEKPEQQWVTVGRAPLGYFFRYGTGPVHCFVCLLTTMQELIVIQLFEPIDEFNGRCWIDEKLTQRLRAERASDLSFLLVAQYQRVYDASHQQYL